LFDRPKPIVGCSDNGRRIRRRRRRRRRRKCHISTDRPRLSVILSIIIYISRKLN